MTDEERQQVVSSEAPPNLWRLTTVHRVEELKSVIRMGPIWGSESLSPLHCCSSTEHILSATGPDHGQALHRIIPNPPVSMSVFTIISMLAMTSTYDRLLITITRRFTSLDRIISFFQHMGVGFMIPVLATLVAGFVEEKRKHVAAAHGLLNRHKDTIPISVLWLVPQYALHGMADAFTSSGSLKFFYDQAPESMRSTATALFC